MEAKKKHTKRRPMTSEEAARTLNLEHDLYLALLTEETRKNYEAARLFDDFFDNLTAEQKFDLIDDQQYKKKPKQKQPQRLSEELKRSARGGNYFVRGFEAHLKTTKHKRWMCWSRSSSPRPPPHPVSEMI